MLFFDLGRVPSNFFPFKKSVFLYVGRAVQENNTSFLSQGYLGIEMTRSREGAFSQTIWGKKRKHIGMLKQSF